MKIYEIYEYLDTISPFDLQEGWDNSGIVIGDKNRVIKDVILSIDIDKELIDMAEKGSLIITHHPLIFSKLSSLNFNDFPTNIIELMIKKDISNIAMHTNFDKTHLNEYVAKNILGYDSIEGGDFVRYFDVNRSFDEFKDIIKDKLSLDVLRCVKCVDYIKRCAITTGSGASLLPFVKADCFLTGDIKYHDAMYAKHSNISMIDIEHFASERYFPLILEPYVKTKDLNVIIATSKDPFTYL